MEKDLLKYDPCVRYFKHQICIKFENFVQKSQFHQAHNEYEISTDNKNIKTHTIN